MKRNGVQIIDINNPAMLEEFYATGKKARQSLVGKLFDQEFLNRVEKSVADFRASTKGAK
jgi:hypothetical protein